MKAGDIVRVTGYHRDWVALPVTAKEIRRGVNARTPGLYLFGGAWYGKDLMRNATYGKVIPATGAHKVVGHVKSRRTLRGDLQTARRFKGSSRAICMIRLREELREYQRELNQ